MANDAWRVIYTNRENHYVSLVSTPLFLYDFLLTFGDEVRYVWRGRFTGATLLFVVNRYATLLACAVNAFGLAKCHFVHSVGWGSNASIERFVRPSTPTQPANNLGFCRCKIEIYLVDVCTAIAFCAFAGFAALRIYALYGLRKRAFWIVLVMGLLTPAVHLLIIVTYEIRRINTASGLSGCFRDSKLEQLIPTLIGSWKDPYFHRILWERIYMVLYETLLIVLTWRKTLGHSTLNASLAQTPMMTLLRRDGTHYFIFLVIATILNVIGLMIPRQATSPLNCIATLVDTLSSMCMSYFILHLRSVDKKRTCGSSNLTTSCYTSMHFADAELIIGNLGESLRDEDDRAEDERFGDEEINGVWDDELFCDTDSVESDRTRDSYVKEKDYTC